MNRDRTLCETCWLKEGKLSYWNQTKPSTWTELLTIWVNGGDLTINACSLTFHQPFTHQEVSPV